MISSPYKSSKRLTLSVKIFPIPVVKVSGSSAGAPYVINGPLTKTTKRIKNKAPKIAFLTTFLSITATLLYLIQITYPPILIRL